MKHNFKPAQMRHLIILILFLFISCGKKAEEKPGEIEEMKIKEGIETPNFHKINYSLTNNYLDSLGKHIEPNKKYQYWQYATYYDNGKKEYTVLKQGGDLSLRKKINEKISPCYSVGIFQGGHPSFRCNYVSTVDNNGNVTYLKTEEEFRDFIGTIDNLEEAMLLARTYGYLLGNDIRASEYRKLRNGFKLHLMKYHEFPERRESIELTITKEGFIKTKSLGIYCEGRDCHK